MSANAYAGGIGQLPAFGGQLDPMRMALEQRRAEQGLVRPAGDRRYAAAHQCAACTSHRATSTPSR
ncbi:hypothetical protein [Xanthomonas sp. D-109]|uniref:hypothetical protein n=1 Tax=Xanthomonas sp. D-109 TaxID=2821274 RepID=UPI001ADD053D|nr:hypothetical protein [Xanthomonas sp. D-109]MBO9880468.1 hypothetical protein [Xanthomonas sp. D-109]